MIGVLKPRLLSLRVGGTRDVQVKVLVGPYLSVGVKAWSSNRFLKEKEKTDNR